MLLYRWYLAQQYVPNPLLIAQRKFGLRVWALVPDINPLRAYLHRNGLLLFSSEPYDPSNIEGSSLSGANAAGGGSSAAGGSKGGSGANSVGGLGDGLPAGHITNYAQNENGMVWDLTMFRRHVGEDAFGRIWEQVGDMMTLALEALVGENRNMSGDKLCISVQVARYPFISNGLRH